MILHVRVYNLAEMYAIKDLKPIATAEFEKLAKADFKLPAFPLAIKEIYESCPADDKTLRDAVVRVVLSNYDSLLKPNEGNFETMKLIELGDFAADLLYAKCTRSDIGDSAKGKDVVEFICRGSCGLWRIDSSKLSACFNELTQCPRCGVQYMLPLSATQIYMPRHKCRACGECLGSANADGQYLQCPSCDFKSTFDRIN